MKKNMAQIDREKEALYSQLLSIESDISSASGAINGVESKLAYVEASTDSLPSRLMTVRGRGYAAMEHLEKSIDLLTKKWTEAAHKNRQRQYWFQSFLGKPPFNRCFFYKDES
ncbi:MAG: hypothetical protein ACUVV4_06425 [Candidatus Bathyarchaeia archaeon]